jgi:hypothetical protein
VRQQLVTIKLFGMGARPYTVMVGQIVDVYQGLVNYQVPGRSRDREESSESDGQNVLCPRPGPGS